MTKLAANCGCGWCSVPADQSKQTENTVQQAQAHADSSGHKVEVHGWVQPRKSANSTYEAPSRSGQFVAPRSIMGR